MKSDLPRIVIVEDNPADVALLRHAIADQSEAVEIIVIPDGEKAIKFIEEQRSTQSTLPCAILLDLHLPRVDGNRVLEAIAMTPRLDHVQVAVWTTLASPPEHSEALRLGADSYQLKPNSVEGFWAIARLLLDMCHGRALRTSV